MATGTANSGPLPTRSAGKSTSVAPPAERERYIERQLRRTRRQVRGVELASRLMLLAAAAVAFFLVAAVFDHWLVPGGLSIYGRLVFLAAFLIGAGWFVARELAPLFVYRINPLFAAQTIERAKPTLKNSLLNFLLLRSNRAGVPDVVLSAVEEQAAASLHRTPIEHVVDHTRLIHIGYLLLAMVAAFCLYYLTSPKSPLQTVGRVVLPWADLVAPSRVELDDVQPGTTTVFRGERVAVSAVVRGLQEDEAVTLYFSTADRQSVEQPLRMYVTKDSSGRHTVMLPPQAEATAVSTAGAGLQQDLEYRIEAGDAIRGPYHLSVIQAPNIGIEKLEYAYPDYTRLDRETVEKTGDIKAVEGTQVTIHALANQTIASAYLDLGGDGRHKQPMKVDSQRATTTITLALNDARTSPIFSHYLVRFVTDQGRENREPIRYRIEVTPDPAPELQLLRPEKVETAVALDAPAPFEVEASDTLYGLADVRIVANVGGQLAFRRNRPLAKDDKSAARLVFKHIERLDRITLDRGTKLKPGDVIEYWAEAVDNKTPKPNITKTDVRKLLIVEPQRRQDPNAQPQKNDQGEGQAGEDRQQDRNQQDQSKQPQDKGGEKNGDRNNDARNNEGQRPPNEKQDQGGDGNEKRDGSKNDGGRGDDRRSAQDRNPNEASKKSQDSQDNGDRRDQQQNQQPSDDRKRDAGNKEEERGDSGDRSDNNQGATPRDSKNQKGDADQKGSPSRGDQDTAADNERQPGDQKRDKAPGETQQQEQRPVDKNDEGEAFNRILKHAQDKDGKTPEQSDQSKNEPSNGDAGNQAQSERPDNKKDSDQAETSPTPSDKQADQKGDGQGEKQDTQKTGDAAKKDDQRSDQPQPAANKDAQNSEKSGEAQNDQSKRDESASDKSGSATPSPQEKARPNNEQRPGKTADGKQEQQPEKSPANGKKDSNTQGEQAGDRRGDGKEGGGQNKNQVGKGADGTSDPADEGAKAADESGKGDTGQKKGDDKSARGKTGESGKEKGSGSKSQPSAGGKENADDRSKASEPNERKTGDRKRDDADQKQSDAKTPRSDADKTQQSKQQPSDQPGSKGDASGDNTAKAKGDEQKPADGGKGTATGGGGTQTGDAAEPPDLPRVQPTDDKANLDYAKRATDLALDHLRNQMKDGKPDQELLDRLGWSQEDVQKLLARWEKMEREAKQPGPQGAKAKENLQEALRSLGFRPPTASRKASAKADDAARGLRDSARSAPPPEYADEFRAFQRSTSRGK